VNIDEIKGKLSKILGITKEELDVWLLLFALENIEEFLGFYYSKKMNIDFRKEIYSLRKELEKPKAISITDGSVKLVFKPNSSKTRIYIDAYIENNRYRVGEVIAKDHGLDIYPYKDAKTIEEKFGIPIIEKAKRALLETDIEKLGSKIRTAYEIKRPKETEKNIDKYLLEKFKDRDVIKAEELEEELKKFGLTLEEFREKLDSEFFREFYEIEPGVFKRI